MRFMIVLALTVNLIWFVQAKSWLSCPPSPNSNDYSRTGSFTGPCEFDNIAMIPVTQVRAGEMLKVGWPSANQGGGYVRLALAPQKYRNSNVAFNENVLKLACFGCDPDVLSSNSSLESISRCNHPCGASEPCKSGSTMTVPQSYQTAIQIPTNLPDGLYLLQWMALMGNQSLPMYSCARLDISGGDLGQKCRPWRTIPVPKCQKAAGPPASRLLRRSRLGEFCFGSSNQTVMPETIQFADTVNWQCDTRLSCRLALNETQCLQSRFDNQNQCRDYSEPVEAVKVLPYDETIQHQEEDDGDETAALPSLPTSTDPLQLTTCLDNNNSWAFWNGTGWITNRCMKNTACQRYDHSEEISQCVIDKELGQSRHPIDTATLLGFKVLYDSGNEFIIIFEISTVREFDKWQMKLTLASDSSEITQVPGVSWLQQNRTVLLEQMVSTGVDYYFVDGQERFKFYLVGKGSVPQFRQALFGTQVLTPPPRRFLVRYVIVQLNPLQNSFISRIHILPEEELCRNGVQLWYDDPAAPWIQTVQISDLNTAVEIEKVTYMQYGQTLALTIEGWDCVNGEVVVSIEGILMQNQQQNGDRQHQIMQTTPVNFRMAPIGTGAVPSRVKHYYVETME